MSAQPLERVKEVFDEYFTNWCISLPIDSLANRAKGEILQNGWRIQYVFGSDERGEYLDFYARHRMTNDRHVRVYGDGTRIGLPSEVDFITYDPKVPGDEDRAVRARDEHNQMVSETLRRKGFT